MLELCCEYVSVKCTLIVDFKKRKPEDLGVRTSKIINWYKKYMMNVEDKDAKINNWWYEDVQTCGYQQEQQKMWEHRY